MNHYFEFIGIVAGTCTTFAFLPQVLKIIQLRSTKDISLMMYIIFCFGLLLWIVYGVLLHSFSLIMANSVTLILASIILILKCRWG